MSARRKKSNGTLATSASTALVASGPRLHKRLGELPTKGIAYERGGDPAKGESAERAVEIHDLGEQHSSGMRFEVRILHPEFAFHQGVSVPRTRQAPEVSRFLREEDAIRIARASALALGGELADVDAEFPDPEA